MTNKKPSAHVPAEGKQGGATSPNHPTPRPAPERPQEPFTAIVMMEIDDEPDTDS